MAVDSNKKNEIPKKAEVEGKIKPPKPPSPRIVFNTDNDVTKNTKDK